MQSFIETIPALICAAISVILGAIVGTSVSNIGSLAPDGLGVRMPDAFAYANRLTPISTRRSVKRASETASDNNQTVWVAVVLLIVALGLYVRYTDVVAGTVLLSAIIVVLSTTVTFLILSARGVVKAIGMVFKLFAILALAAAVLIGAVWLLHPLFHPGALLDIRAKGIFGSSSASFSTVLFQMIGAALSFAALISSVFFCLASVTAVYLRTGALGARLWRPLYRLSRWAASTAFFVLTLILGLGSLLLTSGWAGSLLESSNSVPSV